MLLDNGDYQHCPWLVHENGAPFQVVSSRVRLARNLAGYPFAQRAGPPELAAVARFVSDAAARCASLGEHEVIHLDRVEDADRQFLVERQLISRELANGGPHRMVILRHDQRLGIMINEEDHLRIQCLQPGLALSEIWRRISRLDTELEQLLNFAFDPRWGYLTACPTNTGTGIRCSVMLHLPALVMVKKLNRLVSAVQRMNMAVRGAGGEGSEITGNLFQVSNQQTLGVSEEGQIEQIGKLVGDIIEWEEEALAQLQNEARGLVEDKIWRAYGILQHARSISTNESSELLSALRLGVKLGILADVSREELDQVLICSGPGHLQKIAGSALPPAERDRMRADFIRNRIHLN